jgi:thiosulfate/3-mercaptopyruvate sulfurtransferase
MTIRTAEPRLPDDQTAAPGVLVSPEWLEAHLHDPVVRVVEVDVSSLAYDEWHIDTAVLWNVYQDLKDNEYRPVDATAIERLLARSGIGPDSTVVFYGYAPAAGVWLMKLFGHADARLLDCSRDAWRRDGRPASSRPAEPAPAGYALREEDPRLRADHAAVRDAIGSRARTLVDVRSWDEYRGERFWPSGGMDPAGRAGHVPSAVHQPIDGLYDDRGSFRAVADLRRVFSSVDLDGEDELITYCTIGVRACTAWFVLSYLLGRDHVRVYDGSWAEWGRMAGTPVEQA